MTSLSAVTGGRTPGLRAARVLLGREHACDRVPDAAAVVEMPSLRRIAGHAGRTVLTATVIPTVIFYVTYAWAGLQPAVTAALAWYYAGIAWRLVNRQRVLGAAVLGAGLLTVRSVTVFVTGSATLYFVQPIAGTVLTATIIAVTALAGRPLIDRLAHEFCPLPNDLSTQLRHRHYFGWASLIWATCYVVNAAGTLWLLTSASMGGFLVYKTVLGPVLTVFAVLASYLLLRKLMRRENVVLCWARH